MSLQRPTRSAALTALAVVLLVVGVATSYFSAADGAVADGPRPFDALARSHGRVAKNRGLSPRWRSALPSNPTAESGTTGTALSTSGERGDGAPADDADSAPAARNPVQAGGHHTAPVRPIAPRARFAPAGRDLVIALCHLTC